MAVKLAPLLTALFVVLSGTVSLAQDNDTLAGRGKVLVASNCARCHAIGSTGESPHREAPAFRTLGQRYPIDRLAEALAEGLATGHPDMPEFIFGIRDVGAILAYLQSIQEPKGDGSKTGIK